MFDFGLLNCVTQIIFSFFTKGILTYIYMIHRFFLYMAHVNLCSFMLLIPTVFFSVLLNSACRILMKTENLFNNSYCHHLLRMGAIMLINCIYIGNNGSSSPFRSNSGKVLHSPASTRTLIFTCSTALVETSAGIFCFSPVLVYYAQHYFL